MFTPVLPPMAASHMASVDVGVNTLENSVGAIFKTTERVQLIETSEREAEELGPGRADRVGRRGVRVVADRDDAATDAGLAQVVEDHEHDERTRTREVEEVLLTVGEVGPEERAPLDRDTP